MSTDARTQSNNLNESGLVDTPQLPSSESESDGYLVTEAQVQKLDEHGGIHEKTSDEVEAVIDTRVGWDNPEFRTKFFASSIGNVLEWYDFAIFGYFAREIGSTFFPLSDSPGNSSDIEGNGTHTEFTAEAELLDSFIVFGVAFLVRPIGGILFGYIGDRLGRKKALELSIVLMLVPSFLMGFIPGFGSIGYFATVLLILVRLCQGLACGGELVGAFIYIVESSPKKSRGMWGAACFGAAIFGTALGAAVGVGIREACRGVQVDNIYGKGDMLTVIGWRIAFWMSMILGIIGVLLRRQLGDSTDFKKMLDDEEEDHERPSPIKSVMVNHWREVMLTLGHTSLWTTVFWLSFVWLASFSESLTEVEEESDAGDSPFLVSLCCQMFTVFLFPFVGAISDRVGQVPVMMLGSLLIFAGAIPIFMLLSDGRLVYYATGQACFAFCLALIGAPLPIWMCERFSIEHRYTGMGISYNLAQAIFGGPAAAIATALSDVTVITDYNYEDSYGLTPALYIMFVALIALGSGAIGYVREKRTGVESEPLLAGKSVEG
eukprot:m.11579 g.11579  ORF g.11579 m.11579 type:complete len:547 (+) comp8883_c0_seq1:336-1976(+)